MRTLQLGLIVLKISWQANRFYAVFSVFCKVYESTLFPLIQVLALAELLDYLSSTSAAQFNAILWLPAAYILAYLVKIGISSFLDGKQTYLDFRVEHYLDLKIDEKLSTLDPATFEDPEFQQLLAQMDSVKGSMTSFLDRFVAMIDYTVKFITAAVIVFAAFPIFVPVIVLATLPSFIAMNKYRDYIWPFFGERRAVLVRLSQYIKTLLSADSTSKETAIFKNSTVLINKVIATQNNYFLHFAKGVNKGLPWIILSRIIQFAALIYTQYLNLQAVFAQTLSIGQFTLYFQQTFNLANGIEGILDHYSSMQARGKYLETYLEFLETKPKITSPSQPVEPVMDPTPPVIEFKDVSFKYPGSNRYILKHFNLILRSGEKIALVGENGAGKSTIIKLLCRFYDPTEGHILINGTDLKDLRLESWQGMIGALFQDFIKYQFTFKENVIFGDLAKSKDLELLQRSLKQAGADSYLDKLPKGLNQQLGKMFDDGVDLSGGQWQKLALARAFFRDAPFLILDEPTSAIDAKAEFEIFERVQNLQKDKTVIIISHRFSTVRNADRILVLDEGRIIEEGTHSELMKKQGLYAELFEIQAKGYK